MAAFFADDVTAFANAMRAVVDRDLSEMRTAARLRAAQFSWDSFVNRIDDVLEAVAQGSRPTSVAAASAQVHDGTGGTGSEPESASSMAAASSVTSPGGT